MTHLVKSRKNHKTAVATAVSPVESPPELRGTGQPVHRETRDVGVQISGTHTDEFDSECTSSRPGKSHLTDREALGLVRPNNSSHTLHCWLLESEQRLWELEQLLETPRAMAAAAAHWDFPALRGRES